MMNIAMVSVQDSPLGTTNGLDGGLGVHVAELARELGRRGHRVTVYTRQDGRDPQGRIRFAPGVTVEQLAVGPVRPLAEDELLPYLADFGAELARRWHGRRPDVVHAHHWVSGLAAIAGANGLDIPVAQSFHTLGTTLARAGQPCSPTRVRLEKAIGRSVRSVVATTESERTELVRLGLRRRQVTLVPSGVDVEKFSPSGPALPRGEAPRLVTLMQLGRHQGVVSIIQALARIPDAELVVAGGPARDELETDETVHQLRIKAKEAGVADRVTFIGSVSANDAPKLLRSADLTVSVPAHENVGRMPLESMACGTPVVASPVGGHLDSVVENVTGIHVPADRPMEIARRVRALLADQTHRTALSIGAVDRVRSRFSWDRVANETVKVYESLQPVPVPVPEPEPVLAGVTAGAAEEDEEF
ncbi:glycosyltransferase [Actinoallomurus purpureus]|uniref:glycosyltransferase n=1 Tax=Actinoallomurus purpureus TaxID=478114 RepID=UPI0020926211|nr:glycosyltransferase [Actinoallomurus purpureus]MCO6010600.1 glycosyltransferase [Actinoallomurus purpureus]